MERTSPETDIQLGDFEDKQREMGTVHQSMDGKHSVIDIEHEYMKGTQSIKCVEKSTIPYEGTPRIEETENKSEDNNFLATIKNEADSSFCKTGYTEVETISEFHSLSEDDSISNIKKCNDFGMIATESQHIHRDVNETEPETIEGGLWIKQPFYFFEKSQRHHTNTTLSKGALRNEETENSSKDNNFLPSIKDKVDNSSSQTDFHKEETSRPIRMKIQTANDDHTHDDDDALSNTKANNNCSLGKQFPQILFHINKGRHTGEQPNTCENDSLGLSQTSNHGSQKPQTEEKPFKCDICGAGFMWNSKLVSHRRWHDGKKPYLCDICGVGFSAPSGLNLHTRTHTGDKRFKCGRCGVAFTTKSTLLSHERTHTGEKPHECEACGDRFSSTSSLVRHRRIHTGERPYGCDLCGMKFSDRQHLVKHNKSHTGEKPYKCDLCGTLFAHKYNLNAHAKKKHRG